MAVPQRVRGPAGSAEITRQVEISTLCTHQMAVLGQRRSKNPRRDLIRLLFPASLAQHRASHDQNYVTASPVPVRRDGSGHRENSG